MTPKTASFFQKQEIEGFFMVVSRSVIEERGRSIGFAFDKVAEFVGGDPFFFLKAFHIMAKVRKSAFHSDFGDAQRGVGKEG